MVLKALKIRKVEIHNLRNGTESKASLKLSMIPATLFPTVLKFTGAKDSSSAVDSPLINIAGIIARRAHPTPTQIARERVAVSALGNQCGSYMTTQNHGAITHAH